MTIVKIGSKYRVLSKKKKRNLGTYSSRKGAENRENQINFFKHKK